MAGYFSGIVVTITELEVGETFNMPYSLSCEPDVEMLLWSYIVPVGKQLVIKQITLTSDNHSAAGERVEVDGGNIAYLAISQAESICNYKFERNYSVGPGKEVKFYGKNLDARGDVLKGVINGYLK